MRRKGENPVKGGADRRNTARCEHEEGGREQGAGRQFWPMEKPDTMRDIPGGDEGTVREARNQSVRGKGRRPDGINTQVNGNTVQP